jgi:hypothetical protein
VGDYVVGRGHAGSPGSDGASPYPELRSTCAGLLLDRDTGYLGKWSSGSDHLPKIHSRSLTMTGGRDQVQAAIRRFLARWDRCEQ